MFVADADAPLLKAWLIKRIENTSNADSDVLADYIIALLKHDGDQAEVRRMCEEEIPDFLTEDPKHFLDDFFAALENKSYLPQAPQPPGPQPSQLPHETLDLNTQTSSSSKPGRRKRTYDEQADNADMKANGKGGQNGRPSKQHRRGNPRRPDARQDGTGAGQFADDAGAYAVPQPGAMPDMVPSFDPNDPMVALLQMQAMGFPLANFTGYPQHQMMGASRGSNPQRRRRCRHFDSKGYCARGSTCQFDHGEQSFFLPSSGLTGEEYDPNNALMQWPESTLMGGNMAFPPATANRGRRGRTSPNNSNRGRRGRASLSAEGPSHDRSNTTIVVENIPEESLGEEQVRNFFSQFGTITEVTLHPHKHLAIVRYDDWNAANNAYRSPKVIFENRFVKIFWHKDDVERFGHAKTRNGTNHSKSIEDQDDEPPLDMVEFNRKQSEAQRQHQDREAKRLELEQLRQQLEKQQEELNARHQEEAERLRAKLAEKSVNAGDSQSTGTETLRAQLAALEQEAKGLGLDPNAGNDGDRFSSRGGYRGGRGSRGRGGFAVRGRASFRGIGARHAAYAQASLDNRPKRLAVTGVDFSPADKDEMLRHFLLNLGEFASVETSPTVTYVSFQDRKTAEKFYASLHGRELPGVQGKLSLSWAHAASQPVAAAAAAAAAVPGKAPADETMAGLEQVDEPSKKADQPQALPQPSRRQVDMDYEVGDEDEAWGEGDL